MRFLKSLQGLIYILKYLQEWEAEQKAKALSAAEGWNPDAEGEEAADEANSDDEELPFACFICRKPWEECRDPVVSTPLQSVCQSEACEQQPIMGQILLEGFPDPASP